MSRQSHLKQVQFLLIGLALATMLLVACGTAPSVQQLTPTLSALGSGIWKGQATSNKSTFDMTLTITSVTRNTFTGTLTTGIANTAGYREDTIINGKIAGNSINFSTPTQVMSILNNYHATVSNGQMDGSWAVQNTPSDTGTFHLSKR